MSNTKFNDLIKIEALRLAAVIIALLPIASFVLGYFIFWRQLSSVSVWLAVFLPITVTLLFSFAAYKSLTSGIFERLVNKDSNYLGKRIDIEEEKKESSGIKRLLRGRRKITRGR